jgi:hypothetical protein
MRTVTAKNASALRMAQAAGALGEAESIRARITSVHSVAPAVSANPGSLSL